MWWIIGVVAAAIILIIVISMMNSNADIVTTDQNTTTNTTSNNAIVSENRSSETVFTLAENLSGSSQFASLLLNTGVGTSVGTTTYTVFVPNDAAFAKLGSGYVSNLSSADKKRLAQYHVVSGRALDLDAIKFGTIDAASKDPLNFSVNASGVPQVNNSRIIIQYKAKNGIVYVVDTVMLPPEK